MTREELVGLEETGEAEVEGGGRESRATLEQADEDEEVYDDEDQLQVRQDQEETAVASSETANAHGQIVEGNDGHNDDDGVGEKKDATGDENNKEPKPSSHDHGQASEEDDETAPSKATESPQSATTTAVARHSLHEDDLVAQKFKAIPARHSLGKKSHQHSYDNHQSSSASLASRGSSRTSMSIPDEDRKFAAIPSSRGLGGQRRSDGKMSSHHSLASNHDGSISEIIQSQPGAFAVEGVATTPNSAASLLTTTEPVARMPPVLVAHQDQAKTGTVATTTIPREPMSLEENHDHQDGDETTNAQSQLATSPAALTEDDQTIELPPEDEEVEEETIEVPPENQATRNPQQALPSHPPPPPHVQDEESPMVVAELVDPPIQAVQVIFDEGTPQLQLDVSSQSQQQRQESAREQNDDNKQRNKNRCIIMAVLGTLLLIFCISIPLALRNGNGQVSAVNSDDNMTLAPTPTVSYPYECFRSTMELFRAQLARPNQTQFLFCPHTRIRIGRVANPTTNDTQIIEGDVPLMLGRSNVEVLCGQHGSVHDNCILEGGFAHVLFHPLLPSTVEHELFASDPVTDNITIRGLTFTGELITNYALSSASVIASNKGKNIKLVDCLWENITAGRGLVFAGNNLYQQHAGLQLIEPRDVELILEDCVFRNIIYDQTLIQIDGQSMTMKRCQFENIQMHEVVSFCDDHGVGWYCHGILYCELGSYCALQDLCVSNVEYAGLAAILVASHDSEISLTGTYNIEGIHEHDTAKEENACESGFGRFWDTSVDHTIIPIGCITQEVLDSAWRRTRTCEIDNSGQNDDDTDALLPAYPCYSSTTELLLDQYLDPQKTLYIMCPNTIIKIGRFGNPLQGEWDVRDGDLPLAIFRSNIEVRCGLTGIVENHCVLDGGTLQVVTSQTFPHLFDPNLDTSRTDNITISGMTFTGQILTDGTFGGASVIMSSPGRNLHLVDCLWENITAPQGLVYAGSNSYQYLSNNNADMLLEAGVVDLTISNSTFRNIIYDGSITSTWKQNLTVMGSRFENVKLLDFSGNCPFRAASAGGCQSLMVCQEQATCTLGDVCVVDLEYAGIAPILLATPDSDVRLFGFHHFSGTHFRGSANGANPMDRCASDLAWVDLEQEEGGEGETHGCMVDAEDMGLQIVDSCLLLD